MISGFKTLFNLSFKNLRFLNETQSREMTDLLLT